MKTREQIITSMCVTWRHDYWLEKSESGLGSGTTQDERNALWGRMAQIFDNDIAPSMEFKSERPSPKLVRDGIIKVHSFEFTDRQKKRMNLALRFGPDSSAMRDDGTFLEFPKSENINVLRRILRFIGIT